MGVVGPERSAIIDGVIVEVLGGLPYRDLHVFESLI